MLDITREKAGIFSFGFFESGGGVPAFYAPAWANAGQVVLDHIYICALACKNIGFECREKSRKCVASGECRRRASPKLLH